MPWQLTPYTIPLVVATGISLGLAGFGVYRFRQDRSALNGSFAVTMIGASMWAALYLLQLSVTTLDAKLLLLHLNVGKNLSVLGFFAFVLAYTNNRRFLRARVLGVLALWPVVYYAVVRPTWQYHEFYLDRPRIVATEGVRRLTMSLGTANTVDALWAYGVMATGIGIVVWFGYRNRGVYRWQAGLVVLAAVVPTALNVPVMLQTWNVVSGVWPWAFNPSPVAMSVTGVLLVVAISRYRFLDVVPVARDRVIETMRDGYVVIDDQDRVVDLNRAARELLAVDADPIGSPIDELLPVGDLVSRPNTGDRLQGAIEIRGDGETRSVEVEVSSLSETEGPTGRLVSLRDVTERRSIERRYQALIENSSDLITVLDADGRIQYQSPSVRRILGYSVEELTGESVFGIVHPDDRPDIRDQFHQVVDEGRDFMRTEVRIKTPYGEYRTIEAVGRNLLGEPFVEGLVVNSRDITRRKEREHKLRRKNERLDQFASVVSHDLRNPLSVAQGRTDLARQGNPQAHLPIVDRSLARMEAIIDDVLTLARRGEEVGETSLVDLERIATDAWATVETGGATLTVADRCRASADPDRMRQLFENLFRNAVEHGDTDATVTVGATDGGFYVADDGAGIPADQRESVFESGFTTARDGTGFGLSIVERIANAHGWSIRATESDSGGARFEISGVEVAVPPETTLED